MVDEITGKVRWRIKIVPIVVRSLVFAFFLSVIGGAVQTYGAFARPDLRFRFKEVKGNFSVNLNESTGVVVRSKETDPGSYKVLLTDKVEEIFNPDSPSTYRLDVDCLMVSDDASYSESTVSFEFPGYPQQHRFRVNEANDAFLNLIPITVAATFEDGIYIATSVVDSDLNVKFRCNILEPFPPGQLGSDSILCTSTLMNNLNAVTGMEDYLAVGFALSGKTAARIFRINAGNSEDKPDPSQQSVLGVLYAPAMHPEWSESSWKTILPAAGIFKYTKPYGEPCLFIETGGGDNHWWTKPDPNSKSESERSPLMENDDSWISYYLYDVNYKRFLQRLRLSERRPAEKHPYARYMAYSSHSAGNLNSEISLLCWTKKDEFTGKTLYAYHTISDSTVNQGWKFASDEPVPIAYPHKLDKCIPIRNSSDKLGFVLINCDGSIALFMQPEFFADQEIKWEYPNPTITEPVKEFTEFLGIIPIRDEENMYAFATADGELVVFSESGSIVSENKISDHFIGDRAAYVARRIISGEWKQVNFDYPILAYLTSPARNRLVLLNLNDREIPGWNMILGTMWSLLAAAWIFGATVIYRKSREEVFLTPEEHETVIIAEKKAKELALDRAHEQRTLQARARLGQVADSLAHDLNTPLDSVRRNLEFIEASISFDIRGEVEPLTGEKDLTGQFMNLIREHLQNPVTLTLDEINRRTGELEEFLDENYPDLSASFDPVIFARNDFNEESVREFIEKFGRNNASGLMKILDREISVRRMVSSSLNQIVLSLGIANRLKNLTSRKAFDVRLGIETALQMLQGDLAAHKITVKQNIGGLPGLVSDPVPLIETMTIIIQNAIDVLPNGGEIEINADKRESRLVIAIANNGPQIPEESINRIWERGFSEGKRDGMGLGLYIAKDLIEQNGGEITVSSTSARTAFRIIIPLFPPGDRSD